MDDSVSVKQKRDNGNTALHLAISTDADIEILRKLLDRGAELYVKNDEQKTPLECLKHGSWKTAVNLLKLEKTYDFRDSDNSTLLHQLMDRLGDNLWGIERPDHIDTGSIGYSEQDTLIGLFWDAILRQRENFKIDLNIQDNFGNTPLHIAADFWPSSKHIEVMLTHFDDVNPFIKDCKGNTFLHIYFRRHSIREGTELDARLLSGQLKNLPCQAVFELLRCQNSLLNSPLHIFMKENDNSVNATQLKRIITAGADVNMCDGIGDTALHCALKSYLDSEYEILDDADIELSDEDLNDKMDNINCLVKSGSCVNARNKQGNSPLFLSFHQKTVSTLIALGASVNLKNNLEQTPLISFMCRLSTDLDVIKSFLDAGADAMAVDIHGSNVLHYMAWYGIYTTIPPVLNLQKLKETRDKLGQRPSDVAYERGHGNLFCQLNSYTTEMQSVLNYQHFNFQKQIFKFYDITDETSFKAETFLSFLNKFRGSSISNLINLPSFGKICFQEREAMLLKYAVNDLVAKICKKIEMKHPLFSMELVESGSVGENTKVGLPDEFDFLCIFDKLGDMCIIDEQKSLGDPGYVYLKLRDEFCLAEFEDLFNSERYLDTSKVRTLMLEVFENMSYTHDIFSHPFISFAADKTRGAESPTFQFAIRWVGCMYKDLKIDIDLAPACQLKNYWPNNARLGLLETDVGILKEEGVVLMLQTVLDDHFNPYSKQRISAIKAEKKHLCSLPRTAIDAYRVAKILCNNRICPVLKTIREIEVKDVMTSYMLKNCMFHVLENYNRQSSKSDNKSYSVFQLVLDIFHKMLEYSTSQYLPSFVFPDQNIFTFNRMEETMNLEIDCLYRRAFVKMILQLLGEIQTFSDFDVSVLYEGYKSEYDYDEIDDFVEENA